MIGVQREVTGYERRGGVLTGPLWVALLICGHSVPLALAEPEHFHPPRHFYGRHMDCPTCTADRDRSQATSATSDPQETP